MYSWQYVNASQDKEAGNLNPLIYFLKHFSSGYFMLSKFCSYLTLSPISLFPLPSSRAIFLSSDWCLGVRRMHGYWLKKKKRGENLGKGVVPGKSPLLCYFFLYDSPPALVSVERGTSHLLRKKQLLGWCYLHPYTYALEFRDLVAMKFS